MQVFTPNTTTTTAVLTTLNGQAYGVVEASLSTAVCVLPQKISATPKVALSNLTQQVNITASATSAIAIAATFEKLEY